MLRTCVSPTYGPGHHAALRLSLLAPAHILMTSYSIHHNSVSNKIVVPLLVSHPVDLRWRSVARRIHQPSFVLSFIHQALAAAPVHAPSMHWCLLGRG